MKNQTNDLAKLKITMYTFGKQNYFDNKSISQIGTKIRYKANISSY